MSTNKPSHTEDEFFAKEEATRLHNQAIERARKMKQDELEALKQQLLQAQLTLTPQHPTVISLQQQVDTMSQPGADLARLKSDERSLMSQIAPPGSAAAASIAAIRG